MAHNIVLFGESGTGKSSAINVLMGQDVAVVSDKAVGCTFEFQKYVSGDTTLFDTVGLSEGKKGTVDQSFAVKKLIDLLKSLEGGVSLLIFVMKKDRIRQSIEENYKLFVDVICMKQVPVLLLITGCEMEVEQGKWWTENKQYFDRYGMTFRDVISGCCMSPRNAPAVMKPVIESLQMATAERLKTSIRANMLSSGWKVKGGWKSWLAKIFRAILAIIGRFFGIDFPTLSDREPDFKERLYTYFKGQGYDDTLALKMATEIANNV